MNYQNQQLLSKLLSEVVVLIVVSDFISLPCDGSQEDL